MHLRVEESVVELQGAPRSCGQVQAAQDDRDVPHDVPPGHAGSGSPAAEAPAIDLQPACLRLSQPGDEHGGEQRGGDTGETDEEAEDQEHRDRDLNQRQHQGYEAHDVSGEHVVRIDGKDRALPVEHLRQTGPEQERRRQEATRQAKDECRGA